MLPLPDCTISVILSQFDNKAHRVLVNSNFTASAYATAFHRWTKRSPALLYPAVRLENCTTVRLHHTFTVSLILLIYSACQSLAKFGPGTKYTLISVEYFIKSFSLLSSTFFLSINRFERKKRLHVAIYAFKALRVRLSSKTMEAPYLILGGGYDERIQENVDYYIELQRYEGQSILLLS